MTGMRLGDISKSENCGSICNNSYRVPSSGQLVALVDIFLNFQARRRHTRCIGKTQGIFCIYGRPGSDLKLSA